MHTVIAIGWYELQVNEFTGPFWMVAGVVAAVVFSLLVTGISVLLHPKAVSHEPQQL